MGKFKGIILALGSLGLALMTTIVSNAMMKDEVRRAIAEAKEEDEDETEEDS